MTINLDWMNPKFKYYLGKFIKAVWLLLIPIAVAYAGSIYKNEYGEEDNADNNAGGKIIFWCIVSVVTAFGYYKFASKL